jgi:hypothetical protein
MIAAAVFAGNAFDRGGQAAIAFGNQARQPVDLLGRFGRRLDFDPFESNGLVAIGILWSCRYPEVVIPVCVVFGMRCHFLYA